MRRTNKKKYSIVLFTLILALGVIAGAYALLSDTVTLTGSATVVEADSVGLEITNLDVSLYVKYKIGASETDDTENYVDIVDDTTGLWTLSTDKKELAVAFGNIDVDTYETYRTDATVTVKNTSNVPVTITVPGSVANNGVDIYTNVSYCSATESNIPSSIDGYTEVLAAGAELTLDVTAWCGDLDSYSNGDNLSGTFTISAEKYTGTETPLGTHIHESMMGGV